MLGESFSSPSFRKSLMFQKFYFLKVLIFKSSFSWQKKKLEKSIKSDFCQAGLYDRNEQPVRDKIFDLGRLSDLSTEYEHVFRAVLDRGQMRGDKNWVHKNPAETIHQTAQLIEQLEKRPLDLKNQIKESELKVISRFRPLRCPVILPSESYI